MMNVYRSAVVAVAVTLIALSAANFAGCSVAETIPTGRIVEPLDPHSEKTAGDRVTHAELVAAAEAWEAETQAEAKAIEDALNRSARWVGRIEALQTFGASFLTEGRGADVLNAVLPGSAGILALVLALFARRPGDESRGEADAKARAAFEEGKGEASEALQFAIALIESDETTEVITEKLREKLDELEDAEPETLS